MRNICATPGPWRVVISDDLKTDRFHNYESGIVIDSPHMYGTNVAEPCGGVPLHEAQANAALIAAAPFLLTMLERLVGEVMVDEAVFSKLSALTLEQARKAINEATEGR